MPAPAPLARIRAELRALPSLNPSWPTDAILLLADACREAAIHCEIGGQRAAAEALGDIAARARALAPIFAPALATPQAEQLALTEAAIRHGDGA
jgi:hypothetical protein